MDDKLKHLLRTQIEREVGRGPRDVGAAMNKGRRRRTFTRLGIASALVCAIGVAALLPRVAPFSSDLRRNIAAPPSTVQDCPVSRGQSEGSEWTSPTTFIAGGSFNGQDWVLCARTVENTETSEEGLCMNWRLGDSLGSGMNCAFTSEKGHAVPLDGDYFSPVMGPEEGYLYGAAPADSAAVELVKDGGTTIAGQIYPAPHELGIPFTFFTIFDEPYTEGELVIRDDTGEILVRRHMTHGLSQLLVTLAGDGEGSVRGYRTEELNEYDRCVADHQRGCRRPRQIWIDCPDVCSVALADARITLVAEPAEGSFFEGWSGDCSGVGRCDLVVDEPMTAGGSFRSTDLGSLEESDRAIGERAIELVRGVGPPAWTLLASSPRAERVCFQLPAQEEGRKSWCHSLNSQYVLKWFAATPTGLESHHLIFGVVGPAVKKLMFAAGEHPESNVDLKRPSWLPNGHAIFLAAGTQPDYEFILRALDRNGKELRVVHRIP